MQRQIPPGRTFSYIAPTRTYFRLCRILPVWKFDGASNPVIKGCVEVVDFSFCSPHRETEAITQEVYQVLAISIQGGDVIRFELPALRDFGSKEPNHSDRNGLHEMLVHEAPPLASKIYNAFLCCVSLVVWLQFENFNDGSDSIVPLGSRQVGHTNIIAKVKAFHYPMPPIQVSFT